MDAIIGKHYAPEAKAGTTHFFTEFSTISVGVSLVMPARNGWKLAAAKVRVSGPNTEEGTCRINKLAEKVCHLLDAGEYHGPKNLNVEGKYAKTIFGEC